MVLHIAGLVVSALMAIYSLYFLIMGIFAVVHKRRSIGHHAAKHRFCAVVAARNEQAVIGELVTSLRKQHYPRELFDIVVVPNNCTDDTEGAARRAGARILTCTVPVKTKGQVLKFAFKQLSDEQRYDGFIVFDADNVVHPDFLSRMNDAMCEGHSVVQGYRDSKNPTDTWVSGSSAFLYLVANLYINRARFNLGGSAYLNGTGFLVSDEHYRKYGFDTHSLTEDIEYTVQCNLHGVKVAFLEDAVTYDEQVTRFDASVRQRRRWTTGTNTCFYTYLKQLCRVVFRKRAPHVQYDETSEAVQQAPRASRLCCFDMIMYLIAPFFQIGAAVMWLPLAIAMLNGIEVDNEMVALLLYGIASSIYSFGAGMVFDALTVKLLRRRINDNLPGILGFPVYLMTWLPINVLSTLRPDKSWKPIAHSRVLTLDEVAPNKAAKAAARKVS